MLAAFVIALLGASEPAFAEPMRLARNDPALLLEALAAVDAAAEVAAAA